jgi:hypothetical protein
MSQRAKRAIFHSAVVGARRRRVFFLIDIIMKSEFLIFNDLFSKKPRSDYGKTRLEVSETSADGKICRSTGEWWRLEVECPAAGGPSVAIVLIWDLFGI